MKFLDSHFLDYLQSVESVSLHPILTKKLKTFLIILRNLKILYFTGLVV